MHVYQSKSIWHCTGFTLHTTRIWKDCSISPCMPGCQTRLGIALSFAIKPAPFPRRLNIGACHDHSFYKRIIIFRFLVNVRPKLFWDSLDSQDVQLFTELSSVRRGCVLFFTFFFSRLFYFVLCIYFYVCVFYFQKNLEISLSFIIFYQSLVLPFPVSFFCHGHSSSVCVLACSAILIPK